MVVVQGLNDGLKENDGGGSVGFLTFKVKHGDSLQSVRP